MAEPDDDMVRRLAVAMQTRIEAMSPEEIDAFIALLDRIEAVTNEMLAAAEPASPAVN